MARLKSESKAWIVSKEGSHEEEEGKEPDRQELVATEAERLMGEFLGPGTLILESLCRERPQNTNHGDTPISMRWTPMAR